MQKTITEIDQAPEQIKQSEMKILGIKKSIADGKKRMDTIRRSTACEVASETVEGGKKVFSNAEAREAETERRLQLNTEYKALETTMDQLETEKAEEEINLRYITETFSSNRYKVRLYTADKMERASTNFLGAAQIAAGLSDVLSQFSNMGVKLPTDNELEIPADCPF